MITKTIVSASTERLDDLIRQLTEDDPLEPDEVRFSTHVHPVTGTKYCVMLVYR